MAEEASAVAEPAAEPVVEEAGFDLSGLGAAFDAAFPATAKKVLAAQAALEPVVESAPPAAAPAAPAPAKPAEVPAQPDNLPPDDVFGDAPKKVEEPPKEYDAPESIKKDPKVYKNWNEVRRAEEAAIARAEKAEAKAQELQAKVEKTPDPEGAIARMAELEQMNRELSERISTVDLQSHPEFQRVFVQGRQKKVSEALEVAKEAGIEPLDVERALNLSGKSKTDALDEIVRGIDSPILQAEFGALVKEVNAIDRGRSAALADSKGNLERLAQATKAQEYEAMQSHAKFIDKALTNMADYIGNLTDKEGNYKGCAYFRKLENNPEWNSKVDGYIQRAKDVATNSRDESMLLSKLMMGEAMPDIYDDLIKTRKRNKELESIVKEYKGAEPGLGGGRNGDSATDPSDKNLTFAEAAARGSGLR